MSKMSCEQACALAAFVLADGKQDMTAENIIKAVEATGVKCCPAWAAVFAEYLKSHNPMDLVAQFGSAAAAPAAAAPAAEAEEKKEEKKVEEEAVIGFAFGASSSSSDEEDDS